MAGSTITPRGRYTLDDAARIRRMLIETPGSADCPKCGCALQLMTGANHEGGIWFVRCESCERSIVLDGEDAISRQQVHHHTSVI